MDIKKIAESLGFYVNSDHETVWIEPGRHVFDPINNWKDTGLVLEKMVKDRRDPQFYFHGEGYEADCLQYPGGEGGSVYLNAEASTLQESICKLYLATL